MTALLLLLSAIFLAPVLVILFFEMKYFKSTKILSRIPGPRGLPLIGNAHQIGTTPTDILNDLFLWWHKYGKSNFRFWVGYVANVFVSEVKDVESILTSTTLLRKSDIYDMFHPWLGFGLLTSSGTKWFKHRKMITPSFHFKILQSFHEVMNANSSKFIEKLRTASAGETIFDIQEMAHYFTLDVICDTAMGVSINAMDNHDAEIVKAFKEMCYNINMRAFHPIKRYDKLYKFLPEYAGYRKVLKVLQDFTYGVIEKHQQSLRERKSIPPEIQDEFVRPKQAFLDTLLTATIDGRPLTPKEIYEEVSTFMFGGHDTVTSGIGFTVFMLSRHPNIQQKVFEEQQKLFGDAAHLHRDASFAEISEMKYLDLVIKEAQRLYPSVPMIGRTVDHDYDMNGTILPKGCIAILFIMAMNYNPLTYDDPYICRPERFDLEQRSRKPHPFEYVPFSAGPRNCIGQKFALLELKTVISKIVRTFEILPPLDELVSRDGSVVHFFDFPAEEDIQKRPPLHKYDPVLSVVLTLKSDNGIMIRLRPRN